jgi:hypothetical protein
MSENDERILRAVEHLLGGQQIQEEEITGANAQVDLWRIRSVRTEMLRELLDNPSDNSMKQITNLERYERAARAKWKRFLRSFEKSEA